MTVKHHLAQLGLVSILSLTTGLIPVSGADANTDVAILRQTSKAFASIAKKAIPGVVFIKVEKVIDPRAAGMPYYFQDPDEGDDPFELFFRGHGGGRRGTPPPRQYRQMGQGTGFIISKDGYILTNNHVVGDADTITVRLHDGREFKAERIGSDPRTEVALIRIKGDDFPVLPVGNSDAIDIGEWVIAIGNPFGLSETLTVGVVSAKGRNNLGITDYEDYIQTDAAINPGNSGGPLLNIDGQVIGMNTAIYSQTGGSMGIGFAIPINMIMAIKEQLSKTGKVTRGFLGIGIQDLTSDLAESFKIKGTKGVVVTDIVKGSPAEKSDLRSGDIILEMDGKKMESASAFRNQIAMFAPNTEIKLTVLREGNRTTIKATVGSKSEGGITTGGVTTPVADKVGMTVDAMNEKWARQLGYEMETGVIVTQVQPGGLAAQAGIQPGQMIASVNHVPVKTVDEYNTAMSKAAESKMALLLIKDPQGSRFVVLRLE